MIRIFKSPLILAESFAAEFKNICEESISKTGQINIAISGGNTPKLLFDILAENYKDKIEWDKVNIYWVDERCVPPDNDESNFGMTVKFLFSKIIIPEGNIHRIYGEYDPASEAVRYSDEIKINIKQRNEIPEFDMILL